ncbi:hypothetical protein R1sor_000572 [Riccia sorocarpa]|uniref:Uncharacterized protein n=1 Tax=Riccia sorocarpa TaxID=122646 RepID=A0ABD3GWM8_9MARC
MVTNTFRHQGFVRFRARFKKAFGFYPEPKHIAFGRAHRIQRVFEFMENGRDIPEFEMRGPSNAEVGGMVQLMTKSLPLLVLLPLPVPGVGDDDDAVSDPSEVGNGARLEHEPIQEDGGDDEDDVVYILLIPIYFCMFFSYVH